MPRRYWIFSLVAVVAAAVCVRLGFWQLSRLHQRRARNAIVSARLALPEVEGAGALPADTAAARFRRVRLVGRFDYANEVVVMARTHEGSPGVNVVTPLRPVGADSGATGAGGAPAAVLVNRGWVYSPNGATVSLARWHEKPVAAPDSLVTVTGFVDELAPRPRQFARTPSPAVGNAGARTVLWLDAGEIARRAGYAVAPYVVLMQNAVPTALADSVPVRLGVPPLDEGPHFSYALQWFSFAAIALGGLGIVLVGRRRHGPADDVDAAVRRPAAGVPNERASS